MPKFFVCESGPMGGVSAIWVGASAADALAFTATLDAERANGCEVFERQDGLIDFPASKKTAPGLIGATEGRDFVRAFNALVRSEKRELRENPEKSRKMALETFARFGLQPIPLKVA